MPKIITESSGNRKHAASPKNTGRSRVGKTTSPDSARPVMQLSEEDRLRYIAEAAYYIAERRGFTSGSPEADWLAAETEIDRMLTASRH